MGPSSSTALISNLNFNYFTYSQFWKTCMPLSSIKLTSEALQNSGLWDGVLRGWGTVGMEVIFTQVQEKFGYMEAGFCWCHESCGLWQLFQKCLECIFSRTCWHEVFFFFLPAGTHFSAKSHAEVRLLVKHLL